MANENIIPKRPSNDSEFTAIKANDRDCLSYSVAFNVPNERAYALFHPEFLDESGKLTKVGKKQSQQFFSYARHKEYADAYRRTLTEFLGGVDHATAEDSEEIDGDALARKILSDLAAMVKNGRIQDFEILKIATDILNKYGVLKGSEERVIPPIRVLVARCKSECRYRAFVETLKLENRVFDDCSYCRARAYAEENGFKYDPCKLLDVPQDMIDELDSKNNIKLEDILSGKVEN